MYLCVEQVGRIHSENRADRSFILLFHVRGEGMLMFTELNLFPARSCFYGTTRMIFFDTQSYDSRVYEYESDVRGGYSFPPLYGRGSRWYIVAGWKVRRSVELSFKYSETFQSRNARVRR